MNAEEKPLPDGPPMPKELTEKIRTMSDTPETDAKIAKLNASDFCDESNSFHFAQFARRLERERDTWKRMASGWEKERDEAKEENAKLREALEECHDEYFPNHDRPDDAPELVKKVRKLLSPETGQNPTK